MRLRLLIAAFIFSVLLAFLEQLALANFLFWHYMWFDSVMHFIGGLAIGTFTVALLSRFAPLLYIAAVAFIAVGWEVFESAIGTPHARNFFFDTSVDLLMDALGAITAYALARTTIWRSA